MEQFMKTRKAMDFMIPISDYPTVSHGANLREAVALLQEAEAQFEKIEGAVPRAILVMNDKKRIIGKVSHWDVLRALEPKYRSMGDGRALPQCGWSADFVKSMVENYGLLQSTLEDACRKAGNLKVRNVMTSISEEELHHHEREIVEHDSPLNEVIHLLVLGNLMFIYVRKQGRIVGIIRLSDVFRMIGEIIKGSS
jgi:CBS domain-containing protein